MKMIENRKAMAGQGGFTLIELLVVIAILAVLAGAAVIGIGAMRGNAEDQVCSVDKKTLETAAEAWALDPAAPNSNTVTQALARRQWPDQGSHRRLRRQPHPHHRERPVRGDRRCGWRLRLIF